MRNDQASINRWTWIVALVLVLLLLWMLFNNHGPSATCCGQPAEIVAANEQTVPTAQVSVAEAFTFIANRDGIHTSGDSAHVAWLANAENLRSILSEEGGLNVEGNDKAAIMTGLADSDADKQKKGEKVQAFFGQSVSIENQIVVKTQEPLNPAPPATTAPSAAKLYFETGKSALPADAGDTLQPVIEWLKNNPNTKAVLSGYHDSRGNRAINEELAKNRAKAVREALKTAGVDEARIEMRKPEVVDGGSDYNEARRVEVSIE